MPLSEQAQTDLTLFGHDNNQASGIDTRRGPLD